MVNIRELRIGSWVYYNPNVFIEDEYEPTKEWKVCQIESGNDIDLAIENCYEPIPLTSEILEKNGFPKDEWHGAFPEDGWGILTLFIYDEKIFWELDGNRIEIKFVHQLQNILIDMGIDKEIIL